MTADVKWRRLPRCASEDCENPAEWYMEAGGIGSYYCQPCGDAIMDLTSGLSGSFRKLETSDDC